MGQIRDGKTYQNYALLSDKMKSNIGERKEIGKMDINTALTVFLGLCAAITAIGSAATYIGKAKNKITEPDKKQDERIQKCEDRIRELDGQIGKLREYLKDDKSKIEELEKALKSANAIQLQCLLALLKNAKDPHNTADIDKATAALESYMIERGGE